MAEAPNSATQPATLDDLAALNRELAALVAAGLPLEPGLAQLAQDLGGGAGRLAARLRDHAASGKSLAEAVAAERSALPDVYRAVVEAGLKSGRLSAALEGFADAAARIADLRRIAAQAALYPLLVFIVAWVMLLLILTVVLPRFDWLGIQDHFWATPLRVSPQVAWALGVAGLAAAIFLAWAWWRRSAYIGAADAPLGPARWVPGVTRARQLSGEAAFADLLHLLLSCRLPLVEALPLAAEASGLTPLRQPAARLAAGLAAGQPASAQRTTVRQLPPLVRAALFTSRTPAGLTAGLARAAQLYRDRAAAWIGYVAVAVPVAATIALGGIVAAAYALLVVQPYIATLREMAGWH
jgi:general secretion pathway protein F